MGKNGKSKVQIHPEGARFDHFFQVAIGCCDQSNLYGDVLQPSDRSYFILLKNAQEFGLNLHREFAYFIQKKGAALRFLEKATFILVCAGESAFHMAEQFRLKQVGGKRRTVYRQKGLSFRFRGMMDQTGKDLFPRSAFSLDEHRRFHRGHFSGPVPAISPWIGNEKRSRHPICWAFP